ncbi:hypothetical protein BKG82_27355 [Mycobacteroides chelonae]|uniref:Uncharacterized protein n=1 Tax=Mycobacteroides chelonae TaxID=1774 RepID=A0A1S1LD78_MYCCH|nr:hypothetical protein [Mycobacteroides chelonae]OHU47368.1 hypothetical protein BKG82_27355 [Mycobacteroides chelonae]
MRGKQKLTVLLIASTAIAAGCGREPEPMTAQVPPDHVVDGPRKAPRPPLPAPIPDAMMCGSFATIDQLVYGGHAPDIPAPSGLAPTRPPTDYIGVADALNNTEIKGTSPVLNAAINAYVYAVTNLGAAINHNEPKDRIQDMRDLVGRTGNTVTVFCSQYQK